MKNSICSLFIISMSLALHACGGGGASPSTPIAPKQPSVTNGLISSEQSEILYGYPLAVVESIYQVGQLINPRISSDIVVVNGTITKDCEQSGEYTVSHSDNDSSNNLTPSDTLLLTFTDCVPKFTSQVLSGTADIKVLNASIEISGYSVSLALTASDSDGTVQISTQGINIETIETDSDTRISFRTVQYPFVIGIENFQDTFSSLDLIYSYDQTTLRYNINFDFNVKSQIVGLDFTCESTLDIRGLVFQTPSDYIFRCDASANDNISVNKTPGENTTVYQYTSAGEVSDSIFFNDADLFEGSIGFPLGIAPETEFANTALAITLNASNTLEQEAARPENVSNALYDDKAQLVYVVSHVFNTSPDGVGSVIQKVNATNMTLLASMRITNDNWITRAELSQSGEFLYAFAAIQEQSFIYIISTSDLSIVDTIDLDLYSNISSIHADSIYLESVFGEDNSWIISYSSFGSNENEFLVFNGSTLTSRGNIGGQYNSNVMYSEYSGAFIVLSINGNNTRNISVSRYTLNAENTWEQLSTGQVQNAEIGFTAQNGQFSMPAIEIHDDYVITEYGYVFSRTTFELLTKLNIDKPAVSATSGIIFESNNNGVNNLYELSTLELQRSNFAYETPFSTRPWTLYKGTEELFFYGSNDQLIRVGVMLFD